MDIALLIWVYLSLGSLLTSLVLITALTAFVVVLIVVVGGAVEGGLPKFVVNFKHKGKVAVYLVALIVISSAYPGKDDLKFIIGGSAIVAATKIDGIEKLPANIIDAANSLLESMVEESED